jgi:transcriptional regulator with XRE-family HTH domain
LFVKLYIFVEITHVLIHNTSIMSSTQISEILLKSRIALRLSQTEVAEAVGVVQSAYNNWEAGKNIPKTKYIFKLCYALNLELTDLLPPPLLIFHKSLIIKRLY